MQVCCILAYCSPWDILIWARYIQGCLNVMTVSLSRKENMNHKLRFYVASPRCKCSEHSCIKHLVGGYGLLGLLSCTTHSKKVIEQVNTRCKMIVVAPWWPMMYWSWDLVNQSTKPPLQLLHWSQKQPFSHKYHQNLLHWYLHDWHLNTTQNLLYHSLSKG